MAWFNGALDVMRDRKAMLELDLLHLDPVHFAYLGYPLQLYILL